MTAPRRLQRKREAGWSKGDAVIVDRTSFRGNPFRIVNGVVVQHPGDGRVWSCGSETKARKWATELYRAWLNGEGPDEYTVGAKTFDRRRVLASLDELAGRDLACTCPLPLPLEPDWCHAAYLMDRANEKAVAP